MSAITSPASILPDPVPASAHAHRADGRPQIRLTAAGVLRSERIKLTSLRSIRMTLLVTVSLGIVLSALIAILWSGDIGPDGMLPATAEGYRAYLLIVATFTAPFLALVFGVLGVLAISSEYSSGMILSSLSAVPRRGLLLGAKAVVVAVCAAVTACVLVVSGVLIGVAFLPAALPEVVSLSVLTGALGTVAYLVGITLLAFGVAALLRSTAGGIAVIVGLTFVLPVALQILAMTGWEWVTVVLDVLPASLGSVLAQGVVLTQEPGALHFGTALLAMLAWVGAACIPAAIAFRSRDAA